MTAAAMTTLLALLDRLEAKLDAALINDRKDH